MQVLTHIASRLHDVHEAGYVHRNLKPSNVLWQPSRNRWILIDYGLAAIIGEPAQIGFSLAYAAPEVVRAYRCAFNVVLGGRRDFAVGLLQSCKPGCISSGP
jgi:serine/threonine protein kinase